MNFKNFIWLFLLLPGAVFAQRTAPDSLYTFRQDMQVTTYVEQNGAQLISSGIEKLSTASASYETANGHFRRSQEAEKGMTASFGTSGIATLGKFKLYGDFSFSRVWQDSLAWTLQGVQDNINPYYFAAGKAGAYQRINYTMNALAVYPIFGKQLYLAGGLNYFYNTASRSVDPRPSVQTFHLLLKPELIYQKNHHTIGLGLLWGYEHEDNSVSYRNLDYSGGNAYPDRILYQVFGYGNFYPAGIRNLRRVGDFTGINLNYAYVATSHYIRGGLSYQQHNEDDLFPLTGSANYNRLGSFYLQKYELSLLAGMNAKKYRQQIHARINYEPGQDQNASLGASSYKYRSFSALLDYNVQTKRSSSLNTGLGIHVLYDDQSQRDLSVSHTISYSYVQPGLEADVYKQYVNKSRLKISLEPAVKIPVSNYLAIPSGELNVVFNNGVTYPDYTYYTSTAGVLSGEVSYTTPHFLNGVYSSFAMNSSYTRSLKSGIINPAGTFVPSGSFLNARFSFNIYF